MSPIKDDHLIRNCSWKFKCNKTWDSLLEAKPYSFKRTRYCPDCKENVRLVESEKSLFLAIEHNQCVAIPFEITRFSKQLNKPLLGAIKLNSNKNLEKLKEILKK
jgi:hypothetical protein